MANKLNPTNKLRGLVSKKKRRFQEKGFDLDLSYITDRVVAMGFPSERLEGIYRNPMHEVLRFLDSLHNGHYKIYNLCSERKYDHRKFHGRVAEYPFDDHNPCPLNMIVAFCEDVEKWFDEHPQNVAVIHCKAGKGRTGMMICCFLQHSRKCGTASESLQLFAIKRTLNQKGVTLHSQRRYVRYYESIMQNGIPPQSILRLHKIRMHTIPDFQKGGGSEPWFSIYGGGSTVYYSDPLKGKKGNQLVEFDCNNTVLTNDVKIEFFHKNLKGLMFYFWFHCGFIKNYYFCLRKRELERACKDQQCRHFAPGFKIELFFVPEDENDIQSRERKSTDGSRSDFALGTCSKCNLEVSSSQQSITLNHGFFHIECAQCDKCGKNLSAHKNFIIREGRATCERCEGEDFFARCNSCHRALTDQVIVEVDSLAWHPDCFRCVYCTKMLNHKVKKDVLDSENNMVADLLPNFVLVDGSPYCIEHKGMSRDMHCAKQMACRNKHLSSLNDFVLVLGKYWHINCFECLECGRLLDSSENDYIEKDGSPCCKYHDKPLHCFRCSEMIKSMKEVVNGFGEVWHSSCLSCSVCKKTFDVLNKPIEEQALLQQGKPLCLSHNLSICYFCKEQILSDNDKRIIDGRDWHFYCFTCGNCHKVLDPRKDEIIMTDYLPSCTSHLRSCHQCNLPIQKNDLVTCKGFEFHSDCFICRMDKCGRKLNPFDFVENSGKYYCTFHPLCTKCNNPIAENDIYHDFNGQFHRSCYSCFKCNLKLNPENCAFDLDGNLLCANCHPAPKCDVCYKIITEGHIAVLNLHYHDNCFACSNCSSPFASIDESIALSDSGKPLCKNCNGVPCHKCKKMIVDQILEASGLNYHPHCFTCSSCDAQLFGSYGLIDGEIKCEKCLLSNNLPTCFNCKKALSGKFLVASGKKIHNDCFNCSVCRVSLVGNRYLSDDSFSFFCQNCINNNNNSNNSNNNNNNSNNQYNNNNNFHQEAPNPLHQSYNVHSFTNPPLDRNYSSPSMRDSSNNESSSKSNSFSTLRSQKKPPVENLINSPGRERKSTFGLHRANLEPKEGFLKKQGGRIKTWKRRWFCLTNNQIEYSVGRGDPPLGVITLHKGCTITLDLAKKSIELQTLSPPRVWRFIGDEESEIQSWFQAIQSAIPN